MTTSFSGEILQTPRAQSHTTKMNPRIMPKTFKIESFHLSHIDDPIHECIINIYNSLLAAKP